jgi:hypothetical protein
MGNYMKEKLKELKVKLEVPPKLSETEKEKFTEIFGGLQLILKDTLSVVLDMDRENAYRYMNLLVAGLQKVDVDYAAGVDPIPSKTQEKGPNDSLAPEDAEERVEPRGPVAKPDWMSFTKELTPHQKNVGNRSLDCFKMYEEVGDEIVCPDCSPEKMVACIRAEDPTIDPADDIIREVDEARKAGRLPTR